MRENVNPENIARLTGKRLTLARLVWLTLVMLTVGPYLASVFIHARQLQQECQRPPEVCHQSPVQFTAEDMAQLKAEGFSPAGYAALETAKLLFFSSIWFVVGGLLFVRKSDEPMALLASYFLVTFGTGFDGMPNMFIQAYPGWQFSANIVGYINILIMPLFLTLFPNGRFAPGWTRWFVLFFVVVYSPRLLFPGSPFFTSPIFLLVLTSLLVSMLLIQVYRYRRVYTPSERQQTRWVVFGMALGIGIVVGLILLSLIGFSFTSPFEPSWSSFAVEIVYMVAVAMIPLSIGVAILRYRLFDIDLVIRRTLQYSLLSGLLAIVYFGLIVILQGLFATVSGSFGFAQDSPLVTVLSTLAIAALFLPLRRRVQDFIDKRFYRRKYDAAKVIADFAATARDETDLDKLTARLVEVVDETMQPESVGLWLKPTDDLRQTTLVSEQERK